jgi:hypothetical protein
MPPPPDVFLHQIYPVEDAGAYKLHVARWNGRSQPLDVFVRDREEWNGWNSWRSDKDEFNRPFICDGPSQFSAHRLRRTHLLSFEVRGFDMYRVSAHPNRKLRPPLWQSKNWGHRTLYHQAALSSGKELAEVDLLARVHHRHPLDRTLHQGDRETRRGSLRRSQK